MGARTNKNNIDIALPIQTRKMSANEEIVKSPLVSRLSKEQLRSLSFEEEESQISDECSLLDSLWARKMSSLEWMVSLKLFIYARTCVFCNYRLSVLISSNLLSLLCYFGNRGHSNIIDHGMLLIKTHEYKYHDALLISDYKIYLSYFYYNIGIIKMVKF